MIDLPQEIPPRFVCWLVHVNGSASGTEAQAAFRAVMGYIAEVEAIETAILAGNQADTGRDR